MNSEQGKQVNCEADGVTPARYAFWRVGFREVVLLDLCYVENQSLLFDIEILFGTVQVVLFGKGAC